MPKVVIELQANTQEAVQKIQQFAKAQRDTFDVIRAGNPAMAEASLKVSTLTKASQSAVKSTQDWQAALNQLPGSIGAVTAQVVHLATSLNGPAGLVTAVLAAGAAVAGLAQSMAHDIERLDNLSDVTGLSVAALQSFEQAAREAGVPPEELARSIGKINEAIAGVVQGKAGAADAFRAIGIDLNAMVAAGASAEQILEAVAKALDAIVDPTLKAAAMADLFGNKSIALKVVLQSVAKDGLGSYIAAMKEAGVVTDEETNRQARALDAMADRFDRALTREVNLVKAGAVKVALALAGIGAITGKIFANPEQAGLDVKAALGAPPAGQAVAPSGPRTIPETSDQLKFSRDQADQLAKIQQETLAATLKAQGLELSALHAADDEKRALLKSELDTKLTTIQKISGATETGLKEQLEATQVYQAAVLQLEQQTADQRITIVKSLTTAVLQTFTDLGDQFAKTTEKLTALAAIQKIQDQIKQLNGLKDAIQQGDANMAKLGITQAELDAGILKLNQDMQDIITHGAVPLKNAIEDLTKAELNTVDAGEAWLKSIEGISPALDQIVNKTRAAQAAVASLGAASGGSVGAGSSSGGSAGGTGPSGGGPTGDRILDSTVLGGIVNQPSGSSAGAGLPSFQHGGIVPGRGPQLIIAHGGETVSPAGQPGAVVVNIHPGAVQISGTLIDQQRSWNVLVEQLGQSIERRLRRH